MEPKKYRKNYWSRMLILIVIIIGGISLYLYIKYDYSEKATIGFCSRLDLSGWPT